MSNSHPKDCPKHGEYHWVHQVCPRCIPTTEEVAAARHYVCTEFPNALEVTHANTFLAGIAHAKKNLSNGKQDGIVSALVAVKGWDAAVRELKEERERGDRLMDALNTVMNQPFKGDWDAQAAFVSKVLCEHRRKQKENPY